MKINHDVHTRAMKALIFSEGNGYGHASRDKLISDHFDFPIMTFGKGAEYCSKNSLDFIEIPSPYIIKSGKNVNIVSEFSDLAGFLKPDVLATITNHFRKVDLVIVDGTPLGLAIATIARKKSVYITNDTAALVGVHGLIEKKIAGSMLKAILHSTKAIIVPDFPPPLTITMPNLNTSFPLVFCGPLSEKCRQKKHGKKYLVAGNLAKLIRPHLGTSAVYGDEADFKSCYADAELVISHGGHTTIMESLAYGKPMLSVVEKEYSERYNNCKVLESKNIGVTIDRNLLNRESLSCALEYSKTLDRKRLSLYKRAAPLISPIKIIESALSKI